MIDDEGKVYAEEKNKEKRREEKRRKEKKDFVNNLMWHHTYLPVSYDYKPVWNKSCGLSTEPDVCDFIKLYVVSSCWSNIYWFHSFFIDI